MDEITDMNELYKSLSPPVRDELCGYEKEVTVPAGTRLIAPDVTPDYLIVIEKGSVEICVPAGQKAVSLSVASEGKVLGLRPILADVLPEIEATTLEECTIQRISREDFKNVLERHPEMYFAVARVLSSDLNTAERFLRQAPRTAARARNGTTKVAGC